MAPDPLSAPPKRAVPNWAIAAALAAAALGTYYYTTRAVGTTDLESEVKKAGEEQKQAK
jgi:uncharacterized protein YdgA (DUF945 family)